MQEGMDIERALRHDGERWRRRLRSELSGLLDDLAHGASRSGLGRRRLEKLRAGVRGVEDRLERPFTIVVAGDFKRGKTTLVNALLGQELLTTDIAPETVVVTELRHGPEVRVEGRTADGGIVDLDERDLRSERLVAIQDNLEAPFDHLRVTAPADVLDGVCIVDTPGMGDALWRFDKRVQAYLPLADAVLYVVSSLSPLSETERAFLNLSLRPLDLSKVTFVVNMADLVKTDDDADRLLSHMRIGLSDTFADSAVFALSGLDELSLVLGEPSPRPERAESLRAAFSEFRAYLDDLRTLDRDMIRTERAIQEGIGVVGSALGEVQRAREALTIDRGELAAAAARVGDETSVAAATARENEARVRGFVQDCCEEAIDWMRGLVSRIGSDVLQTLDQVSHEQVQKHLPFFLASTLRDGVTACLDAHQGPILDLLVEVSADELDDALPTRIAPAGDSPLDEALAQATFPSASWTAIDHLHLVNAVLPGLFGVFGSAALGVVDSRSQVRAESFERQLLASIPDLEEKSEACLRQAYGQLSDAVVGRMEQVHASAMANATALLEEAMAVQDAGSARIEATDSSLATAETRLTESIQALQDCRAEIQRRARG